MLQQPQGVTQNSKIFMTATDIRRTKPVVMMVKITAIMVNTKINTNTNTNTKINTKINHGYPNCLIKNHKLIWQSK